MTKIDGRTTRWPPTLDRLVERIGFEDECWVWQGGLSGGGYGSIRYQGRSQPVHRVVWIETVGPISDDLTLDHLCRNRRCVNPDHLEPCSRGENALRGETVTAANLLKTRCPQGHIYDDVNTYRPQSGGRYCRTCGREASRRYEQRRRA